MKNPVVLIRTVCHKQNTTNDQITSQCLQLWRSHQRRHVNSGFCNAINFLIVIIFIVI